MSKTCTPPPQTNLMASSGDDNVPQSASEEAWQSDQPINGSNSNRSTSPPISSRVCGPSLKYGTDVQTEASTSTASTTSFQSPTSRPLAPSLSRPTATENGPAPQPNVASFNPAEGFGGLSPLSSEQGFQQSCGASARNKDKNDYDQYNKQGQPDRAHEAAPPLSGREQQDKNQNDDDCGKQSGETFTPLFERISSEVSTSSGLLGMTTSAKPKNGGH